jgi:hypothetical protein
MDYSRIISKRRIFELAEHFSNHQLINMIDLQHKQKQYPIQMLTLHMMWPQEIQKGGLS